MANTIHTEKQKGMKKMAMYMNNEQDTGKKKKSGRSGFYAALAICVLAIGIAAWSTYDTMSGFLTPADTEKSTNLIIRNNSLYFSFIRASYFLFEYFVT